MDQLLFEQACARVRESERAQNGIGTLGEKTLHAVLKHYFEPYADSHETKVGGYVADIVGESGIIEVQTRGFDRLRKKLTAFLEVCPVTVVYPIPCQKWLIWIDEQTGETTPPRKSPKRGRPADIFPELYRIKPFLTHPNLRFCIVLMDMEEYRYQNGWSHDKKRGSTRCDRLPLALCEELYIGGEHGFDALIPDELPQQFTSKDYKEAASVRLPLAQKALNVLHSVKAVERVGKQGRSYLYERA